MPWVPRPAVLAVRGSEVAGMAMDRLSRRFPAADRVLPSGIWDLSCGLPFISRIGAGIGQSRHPEVAKTKQNQNLL